MIPVRHLQDLTECPICQNIFNDPRSLPCVHTFCFSCIATWAEYKQSQERVECPVCRKEFTIPDRGLGDLPRNIFMAKLLDFETASSNDIEGSLCDWCLAEAADPEVKKTAREHCVDCKVNLCDDCIVAHAKIKTAGSHRIIRLGEVVEDVPLKCQLTKCDKHPDKDLEVYCCECEETVCLMCCVIQHNGHKSCDAKEVVGEFSSRIKETVTRLEKPLEKFLTSLSVLQQSRNTVIDKFIQAERDIYERADQLVATIERHKQQLLSEWTLMRTEALKRIDHDIGEVTQKREIANSISKRCEELLKKGSISDITRETKSLCKQAAETEECDLTESVSVAGDVIRFSPARTNSDDINCLGALRGSNQVLCPSLTCIIPGNEEVSAIASLNNQLFVTRRDKFSNQIAVYDTSTFQLRRHITVSGATGWLFGLATCSTNNCLYVSDYNNHTLYKVTLLNNAKSATAKWQVAKRPVGLSVNRSQNILVACDKSKKIQEYSPIGSLLREILDTNRISQAVEITDGILAVGRYGPVHGICIMSVAGDVLHSYGSTTQGSGPGLMSGPRNIAVDKQGFLLVADRGNNRISVLNRDLTEGRPISLPIDAEVGQIQQPRCLWLDESRDRLYVGEHGGQCRILIFDSVFNLRTVFTS